MARNFFIYPPSFPKFKWTMLRQKVKKDENLKKVRHYLLLSLDLLKRLQTGISLRSLARRALRPLRSTQGRQVQDRPDEKKHRAQGKKPGYGQEL
jgi:hypothetical protein